MAPKSLFERPIIPRPTPNSVHICEHPKIIEGNKSGEKVHIECRCACKSCFDSTRVVGKRCVAANHCSVHFNIETQQRKF